MTTRTETVIVGNLTADPDLRYTSNGTPVANFSIAVNNSRKNEAGQWEDAPADFFRVTCWSDLASNVAESLQKGTRVVVSGNLKQRSWTNDQGEERKSIEVVANVVGAELTWASVEVRKNERRRPEEAPHPADTADTEEPF